MTMMTQAGDAAVVKTAVIGVVAVMMVNAVVLGVAMVLIVVRMLRREDG